MNIPPGSFILTRCVGHRTTRHNYLKELFFSLSKESTMKRKGFYINLFMTILFKDWQNFNLLRMPSGMLNVK